MNEAAKESASAPKRIWLDVLLVMAVCAYGLFLYARLFNADFTNYDDDWQITENPYIRSLGAENLKVIFTQPIHGMYLPLKTLSYAFDYHFWKLDPFGYRLTSFIFFALTCVVLYWIIKTLLASRGGAFFGTLIFAVHPLHVEVLGWLSDRKDVLSLFFYLLAFLLFIYYRRRLAHQSKARASIYLILSCISFVLALASKATSASLPLVLFTYDCIFNYKTRKDLKIFIADKVPFILLGVAAAFWTLHLAHGLGFAGGTPFTNLLPKMVKVFASYIALLVVPVRLSIQYLIMPVKSIADWKLLASAGTVVLFIIACVISFKKSKLIFFCLMWYVLNFIPVSHLVPVNVPSLMADRYIYLSSIALSFLVALGIARREVLEEKFGEDSAVHVLLVLLLAGFVVFFSVQTVRRTAVWKDSLTLWKSELGMDDISVDEVSLSKSKNYNAYHNLGATILGMELRKRDAGGMMNYQNLRVAAKLFYRARDLKSDYILSYMALAQLDYLQGDSEEALAIFDNVISMEPGDYMSRPTVKRIRADAHLYKGLIYADKGMHRDAVKEYEATIQEYESLGEDYRSMSLSDRRQLARACFQAGEALLVLKEEEKGKLYFDKAKEIDPSYEEKVKEVLGGAPRQKKVREAYENYKSAMELIKAQQYDKALFYLDEAVRIEPTYDLAHANIGACYSKLGRNAQGIKYLEKKAADLPDSFVIRYMLGQLYLTEKKLDEAEKVYKEVLDINPRLFQVYLYLARVYQEKNELRKAQDILELARRRFPKNKEVEEKIKSMEERGQWAK